MSAAACRRHPDKVLADLERFMSQCDVLCLEEAGEGQAILAKAVRTLDVEVHNGFSEPGQAATPVMFKRKAHERKSFPLTPKTHVGAPGAGPNTMKAKWLNIVRFSVYGHITWVGSIHTTPSVYIDSREALAMDQTRSAAAVTANLRGWEFIGGDYNSLPGSNIRRPLERRGITSAQKALGPVATHGNRSIDDVHYKKNKSLKPTRHWTRKGVSDHDAYFVEFTVKPTRRWKIRHKKNGTRRRILGL